MGNLILPFSMLLYIVLPIWMLTRGWTIGAGIAMIVVALLPWAVWRLDVQGSWGPGAGFAFMLTALMLLLALLPIGLGVARAVSRYLGGRQKRAGSRPFAEVSQRT